MSSIEITLPADTPFQCAETSCEVDASEPIARGGIYQFRLCPRHAEQWRAIAEARRLRGQASV